MVNVHIFEGGDEHCKALVSELFKIVHYSIEKYGDFWIGLSGGSVLNALAAALPSSHPSYRLWRVGFVDERLVPHCSPDSNCGEYGRRVFSRLKFEEQQVLSIFGNGKTWSEDDFKSEPSAVAAFYEALLVKERAKAGSHAKRSGGKFFDCLVLGVGSDGHTASLFPNHPSYVSDLNSYLLTRSCSSGEPGNTREKPQGRPLSLVIGISHSPKAPPNRISFSIPLLGSCENVLFFAGGAEKADVVVETLLVCDENVKKWGDTEWTARLLPAALVSLINDALWLIDKAAASKYQNHSLT